MFIQFDFKGPNLTHWSIIGPISMGQWDARNTKHSVQTFFNMAVCCRAASCLKCSLSFACFTQATKICAITLKFNVRFDSKESESVFDIILGGNSGVFASSKIFDWIIGFCFRGPRSSWTAAFSSKWIMGSALLT